MTTTDFVHSVNIPHVHFLEPSKNQNPPFEKYDLHSKHKSNPGFNRKVELIERSKTEWGFTKRGMVELPSEILNFKGRSRNVTGKHSFDPRINSVVEKGNWHRARNSNLRWNQASMFSQGAGLHNLGKSASSNNTSSGPHSSSTKHPSAYEVSLRKKGMLPTDSVRPVTGGPSSYIEQVPKKLQTTPLENSVEQVSIGVNTGYHNDIATDSQALLNIMQPPMNREIPKAKIRYSDDSWRRRRSRPRPKTSSAAFLTSKSNESTHQMQRIFHWSPYPMTSELEMKRAYSTVTGEKIGTQSRVPSSRCSRTAGRADLGDSLDDPPIPRNLRIRALKSAPLASLLQRQQMPTTYTINGNDSEDYKRASTAQVKSNSGFSENQLTTKDPVLDDLDQLTGITEFKNGII